MILKGLQRTFRFSLQNIKNGKILKRKAKGETRMIALAYLIEKIKHPENYVLADATSAC